MLVEAQAEYLYGKYPSPEQQGFMPVELNIVQCATDDQIEEELVEKAKSIVANKMHLDKTMIIIVGLSNIERNSP